VPKIVALRLKMMPLMLEWSSGASPDFWTRSTSALTDLTAARLRVADESEADRTHWRRERLKAPQKQRKLRRLWLSDGSRIHIEHAVTLTLATKFVLGPVNARSRK